MNISRGGPGAGSPIRRRLISPAAAERWGSWVEPTRSGLPNRRVLFALPVVLLVVLIALVAFGLTGSSTGILNHFMSKDKDPALIAGIPQSIRSDEWLVQTSLVIAQVEQGLPTFNQNFPGGIDSTVQSDLPSRDWSIAFRPHLIGFLFLPIDNAMALRWWLPGLSLIAACYMFLVTMRPKRPISSAMISVGFFFAPFFQWWFLPITFWPAVWSFVVMTAALWLLKSDRRTPKILWSAAAGYLTVTMAIGVYVPFMIPAALVAVAFVIGILFSRRENPRLIRIAPRIRALIPLLLAGAAAVVVVLVWLFTRLETIQRFLGTLYPGQRLTGTGTLTNRGLLSLLAAPESRNLGIATSVPLDSNASEASSFFLMGLFLFIPLVWFLVRQWRRRNSIDWLTVSLFVLAVVFVAYLLVPGWDALSHLLLLDRTTAGRLRIGIGILSIVLIAVLSERVDESNEVVGRAQWPALVTTAVAAASTAGVIVALYSLQSNLVTGSKTWIPISLLFVAAVYFLSRGRMLLGSGAFLVISLVVAGGVNPLYHGVYDLNDTALVRDMKALPGAKQGEWVGIGHTFLPGIVLVQSGLNSYNGFQSAPSPTMWKQIDPSNRYEQKWNRLAIVNWLEGSGTPKPFNSQADTIIVNFDSCVSFAQKHVRYVLSDVVVRQPCLGLVKKVQQGPTSFWIYSVVHN